VLRLGGLCQLQLGRPADALAMLRDAVKAEPNRVDNHCYLGRALAGVKRMAEAENSFRRALSIHPGHLETLLNMAAAQQQSGNLDEAITTLDEAVNQHPQQAQLHYNRAITLRAAGRINDAINDYRQAVAMQPAFPEALYNLGNLLQESGDPTAAAKAFKSAIDHKPGFAEAHDNLGNALMALGKLNPAMDAYRAALAARPDHGRTLNNLGNALSEANLLQESVDTYRKAMVADSSLTETRSLLVHQLQKMCDWDGINKLQNQVLKSIDRHLGELRPFPLLAMPSSAAQQYTCARDFIKASYGHLPQPFSHKKRTGGPITIGYLSADFRQHPVAYLMADLLKAHDRQTVRVIGYSYGKDDGSDIRKTIASACDDFVDLRETPHLEAAQRIYDDGVDILVDLMGHTKSARLEILALRPAPVQMLMLGYAGTSGADFIDYIVADDFVLPQAAEGDYSEKPLRLPTCFMPNTQGHPTPAPTPSRSDCGLPETGTVFCSFNNSYKISPQTFASWMRILSAVPDAVLWLSRPNPFADKHLKKAAHGHGIDPSRLIFAPKVPAIEDHLARYRVADLFLDTRPYNAHATSSDALWCGCPVLTCPGDTFASRVAGSLLNAIGTPELIANSMDDYEAMAIALANDPEQLKQLRQRIDDNRTGTALFDTARYARALEHGFTQIWARHLAGEAPTPVNL
jgi:predicted O-linked N-acetylglucosamine transferase (SPINDLY family)